MKLSKSLILVLPAAALTLASCQQTKQVFGMKKNPPNEFTLMQRAPLEVPPEYNLRPPQPGVKRPQEASRKSAQQRAKDVVLKNRKVTRTSRSSNAEQRLLAKAGAPKADANIRSKVDSEAYLAANKHDDKSWLRKKLPFSKGPKHKNLIDPKKEAERLKGKGARA